jgi:hypothetical protein
MDCGSKVVFELTDNYPEFYTHNEPFPELRTSLKKATSHFLASVGDRAAAQRDRAPGAAVGEEPSGQGGTADEARHGARPAMRR